jgi:hypothetical protein
MRRGRQAQFCWKSRWSFDRTRGSNWSRLRHKAGVTLAVMLQHRFRPAGVKLREMLAAGELGRIVNCSTVIRLWRPQSYYDVEGRGTRRATAAACWITQGIHTLDLMLSLAGPDRRGARLRDDLERAPHGDRGHGGRGGEVRQRRARHHRRDRPRPIRALPSASRSSARRRPPRSSAATSWWRTTTAASPS